MKIPFDERVGIGVGQVHLGQPTVGAVVGEWVARAPGGIQGTGDAVVGPGDLAVLLAAWGPYP